MTNNKLQEGMAAPDFSGKDQNGDTLKISDFKGKKLILYFYPKDNTPGCTAESCNLNEHYDELTSKGFQVVGVSPDDASSHLKFIAKYNLNFKLIADTEKEILKKYEAWGEKNMYGKIVVGVIRKTYIIDEQGKILKIIKRVKTKEHTQQILSLLEKK